jgi:hypothetical protein
MWGIILVTKQQSAPFQLAHSHFFFISYHTAQPNQPTAFSHNLAGAHWLLFFSTLLRRVFPSHIIKAFNITEILY